MGRDEQETNRVDSRSSVGTLSGCGPGGAGSGCGLVVMKRQDSQVQIQLCSDQIMWAHDCFILHCSLVFLLFELFEVHPQKK